MFTCSTLPARSLIGSNPIHISCIDTVYVQLQFARGQRTRHALVHSATLRWGPLSPVTIPIAPFAHIHQDQFTLPRRFDLNDDTNLVTLSTQAYTSSGRQFADDNLCTVRSQQTHCHAILGPPTLSWPLSCSYLQHRSQLPAIFQLFLLIS